MSRRAPRLRRRCALIGLCLGSLNLAAFGGLMAGGLGTAAVGVGLIAYLLGVRHAFDADHIAAIDNVTRRLRARGQRPLGVGLFFSLGHSTVVLLLTAVTVLAARRAGVMIRDLTTWGSLLGTAVSAGFLTLIGVANLRLLAPQRRRQARVACEPHAVPDHARSDLDRSWKTFPLGMLFGLSFDTASEIALLALSVAAAHNATVPLWGVMSLPLLFAAGMASTDTVESLMMLRLYDWALRDHDRTLRLNTAITAVSVCLALAVAAYEWIKLYFERAGIVDSLPGLDGATVGLLATVGLCSLGGLAWLQRRRLTGLTMR